MSILRRIQLQEVYDKVDDISEPPLNFTSIPRERRRVDFKDANDVMTLFLEKMVGDAKTDQVSYLIYQIKRILPRGKHINAIVADLEPLKSWTDLSKNERKTYRRDVYKVFDETLLKFCGTDDIEAQRKFLNARFQVIHGEKENFTPLVEQPS